MRILQLIDSLEMGGAERMAVNYANSLSTLVTFSALVSTRKEGMLKEVINEQVHYLHLNKKSTFDFMALFRLRQYCKFNQIDTIQAHGSSFLLGTMLKAVFPKVRIIWHDHNGLRDSQSTRKNVALWMCSHFFSGIVVVNRRLEKWAKYQLGCRQVIYLPNYTVFGDKSQHTTLLGNLEKKILYVANLRVPKNHILVAKAAAKMKGSFPDWTFHFVGQYQKNGYFSELIEYIKQNDLQHNIYIYGQRTDLYNIINQAQICVLASDYEGLPLALLEYGLCGKPTLSTSVGEIPNIIEDTKSGLLVDPNDIDGFTSQLISLLENPQLRVSLGTELQKVIRTGHSEEAVISSYLNWLGYDSNKH